MTYTLQDVGIGLEEVVVKVYRCGEGLLEIRMLPCCPIMAYQSRYQVVYSFPNGVCIQSQDGEPPSHALARDKSMLNYIQVPRTCGKPT